MSDLPDACRVFAGGPRRAVALHCSLAHAGAWANLAAALRGLTITAPDLPGHGRAEPWTGARSLHDMAYDIALAVLRAQGGAVDLIGHSFGATVALRVALDHPDLVRTLTLIEPVLFAAARGDAAFALFAAGYAEVDRHIDSAPALAAQAFHAIWGAGDFASLPERQRRYMTDRMGLIRAQNDVLLEDRPGMLAPGRLEGFDRPTLLIEGAESPTIVAAIHGALAARLPKVQRHVIGGAGHMLPITHAAAVAAVMAPLVS